MICDNPKCRYFKPLPSSLPEDAKYVEVVVNPSAMFNSEVKRVRRQLYMEFGFAGRARYLCDACHHAVVMMGRG